MKKYSNDPIKSIVNLGDNSYEFCFNIQQGLSEANGMNDIQAPHVIYMSDVVTVEGIPNKSSIIQALIADGKTEIEANELVKDLV